jgi:hypothetical protein
VCIGTQKITEDDQKLLDKVKKKEKEAESAGGYEVEVVEQMTGQEILAAAKEFKAESVGDFSKLQEWTSADAVLALASAN